VEVFNLTYKTKRKQDNFHTALGTERADLMGKEARERR
jgi:hypothetical protein